MGDSNPPDSPDTHAYNRRLLQKPDAEIQKLKAPPLFFIAAENFSLVLYGKRNKVTVRSNHALLKKDLSIVLTGDVKISTDKGQMSLGDSATLSLNGRMLKFSYGENGEKFAIKF